jgi:hypothetical protein
VNVYWLEERGESGLRFATRDAAPGAGTAAVRFTDTGHFEEANTIYSFGEPAAEGDPHFFWIWFEPIAVAPRVTTFTHAAPLPGLDPTGAEAVFRALFSGRSDTAADPDHSPSTRPCSARRRTCASTSSSSPSPIATTWTGSRSTTRGSSSPTPIG